MIEIPKIELKSVFIQESIPGKTFKELELEQNRLAREFVLFKMDLAKLEKRNF